MPWPVRALVIHVRKLRNAPKSAHAGKVKYVGLSEVGPSIIRRAHAIHPLTLIEQEWSIWSRDLEEGIVPVCKELGIGILAYSPLGRGFLTGAIDKAALAKMGQNDFRAVGMPRLKVRFCNLLAAALRKESPASDPVEITCLCMLAH